MNNDKVEEPYSYSYSDELENPVTQFNDEQTKKPPNRAISILKSSKKWIICLLFFMYMVAACIITKREDRKYDERCHEFPDTEECKDKDHKPRFNQAIPVIVIWIFYLLKRIGTQWRSEIKGALRGPFKKIHAPFEGENNKKRKLFMWSLFGITLTVLVLYVLFGIIKPMNDWVRLVGFGGLIVLYLVGWACSAHRNKIRFRPILGAFCMQWILGLLVMRTEVGFNVLQWTSDITNRFLGFIQKGSEFVFGADPVVVNLTGQFEQIDGTNLYAMVGKPETHPANTLHYFALMVIPCVIYVGAITSVLYHSKLIQPLIKGLGWAFGGILGTTVAESVSAAGNIFLGQTEAPLLIAPFIGQMSNSELHAIQVGGFATVSGSIMSAYISLGIPAGHLLSSICMSSTGSLGLAKLLYPETDPEKLKKGDDSMQAVKQTLYADRGYMNVIEAAAAGASDTIGLALNIGAMLLAFLSIIELMNVFLNWTCALINIQGPVTTLYPDGSPVTIELILGYLFSPVVYCMGVTEFREAKMIGKLLGLKLMATEMTAFVTLGMYKANNEACLAPINDPLYASCNPDEVLSERAITIASYLLCGFGNFGSVGIVIGGLTPLAPNRRSDIVTVVPRSLLAGTLTNMIVATIAGIIIDPNRVLT